MADSALRKLLILQRIPREPLSISTKEIFDYLADQGFGASIRTIQRDIQELSSKFPLIETPATGRGKEGVGWAFKKEAVNQGIPKMAPSSALTLLMGYENLKTLLPDQVLRHITPYLDEAKDTLKIFDQKNFVGWTDKIRILPNSVLQPAELNHNTVAVIYTALLENKSFSATYRDNTEQVISPYGIIQRANTLYLICGFFDYEGIRITAMHRYSNIELLDERVNPPPEGFSLDDYIDSGEMAWPWGRQTGKKVIKFKARVNEYLNFHLTEFPMSHDQKVKPLGDDWYQITASVLDSHELRYWLLSQGDSIEIQSPKAMRLWFSEIAENVYEMYK